MTTTSGRLAPVAAVLAAGAFVVACSGGGGSTSKASEPESSTAGDLGVETAGLSPTIDNPYVAFSAIRRAAYEGTEGDADTGETVTIGVESVPRGETTTIADVEVAIVDVTDSEDGAVVEQTEDYYAQDSDGTVYYVGEGVDDLEDGDVVGHGGEWRAGQDGNRAGVFMPAEPAVGVEFEQERAPGIAEDRSRIVAVGITVTVPAGTFTDCIETEDLDPIDDVTEHKVYCRGVGLVREVFPTGGSLDLVEVEFVGGR